jgi:hypothetical protein
MVTVRGLFENRSVNAPLAWLSTGVLVLATVVLLSAGEWLWGVFGLLAIAVVSLPLILTRDPATTMPGELVALVAFSILLQAAGVFVQVTPYVAIAGLALLVVLALDGFTSLEMTPRFAVLFVGMTTMAFAGGWAIAQFAADAVLGTDYLEGQRELNLDLLTATIVGVLAGITFEAYFRETDGTAPLQGPPLSSHPRTSRSAGGNQRQEEGSDGSQVDESQRYRLAIRTFQVLLVGIVGYSLVTLDGTLFVNSVVPLALTFLPAITRWKYGHPMHARLALLISLAATLHAVGALGPYSATGWYDTVTHALSSTLVAGVGYTIGHGIDLHTDRVSFSPRFRGVFIVLFVLSVGVLWELLEFASGLVAAFFGPSVLAQYGVDDIVKDLVFNTVGAIVVALWGTGLFRRPARAVSGSVGGLLRQG